MFFSFKKNVQAFVNEIKSMTETITILKEELKYDSATKQDQLLDSLRERETQNKCFSV